MKPLLFGLIGVAVTVHANDYPQDHKCHVLDDLGTAHIHFVSFKPSLRLTAIDQLPGQWVLDGYGKPKAKIAKVEQCVRTQSQFASRDAQLLDENTPR
ncbi:TapY2 family type IVa secretion system protein [Ferrimonas senticii]|uniref:TapY2 family type IVa secretion system protein n=1 Tax=Ferrimonas senticii TaxID=394566 RepID=UPI0003F844AA|nr:TapY2 family type IVa secretion system protein [Ferrimonas senticii]